MRGGVVVRSVSLVVGLFVFALGIVLQVESELGLPPWDVLNQGIAKQTPLTFGMANVAVAVVVMTVAWRLGARLGPGTVANAVLVGTFIDLLLLLGWFQDPPLALRIALLGGGVACIAIGSAFYIGAMFGAGPRDSLMLVLTRRSGWRVGVIRACIESGATLAGFVLGGTVGVGTLIFALAVGPVVETSFALLRRSPLAYRAHMSTVSFVVEEAGCASCATRVRSALEPLGHVEAVEIDEATDEATVRLTAADLSERDVQAALDSASDGAGHAYRVRPGSWAANETPSAP